MNKINENANNKPAAISSCQPNIVYSSLYDSKKGKKKYVSSYTTMISWLFFTF